MKRYQYNVTVTMQNINLFICT